MTSQRQRRALLVVLCCTAGLLLPADAARADLSALAQLQVRSLLQDAPLGNSNGCLATIPKCEPGACATRDVGGVARWVCLRCVGNYEPVVTSDGQDNIIQCVCSKGYYEASADATLCTRCPRNSVCPGGDHAGAPLSRGPLNVCGPNLVTRLSGARNQIDCVAPGGFALTSASEATPCGESSYAPPYNRLARCLKCQSGLKENPFQALAPSNRTSKRAACKVPPGRYISQGLVRWCPQGFFRAGYTDYDAAEGQACGACGVGITTSGAGGESKAACNTVLPGYGVFNLTDAYASLDALTAQLQALTLPQAEGGGLPDAWLCPIGTFAMGFGCVNCPFGTTTQVPGATAPEQCMVPPGYVINATETGLAKCPEGSYRSAWVMYSDPAAKSCTPCGSGISSDSMDVDVNPLAAPGSSVRATSDSCYIEAGQGMILQQASTNTFVAVDCPVNTYGASGRVYGLRRIPCKPCARNLITDGATRVNNSDACINDVGFGYASEGGSRCAPGFYCAKGSRKPCTRCPAGRTTLDLAAAQGALTDCLVMAGYGLVTSNAALHPSPDGVLLDNSTLSAGAAALLPSLQCPVAYYGPGGAVGSTCVPCPPGTAAPEPGATSAAECTVCLPGYGKNATTGACEPCPSGFYQVGGGTECAPCPSSIFYAPLPNLGEAITSPGVTLAPGATGEQACVPASTQLPSEAGQAYFSAEQLAALTKRRAGVATMTACLATCRPGVCCMAQWNATGSICYTARLPYDSVGTAGVKLVFKLPPASLTSASKVAQAKMMSANIFGRCAVPETANKAAWLRVGVTLDATSAQSFRLGANLWMEGEEADCQRVCRDSVLCFGFLYDVTAKRCSFRGGEDALGTRSFFTLPDMSLLVNGTSPSDALTPDDGDLPVVVNPIVGAPACGAQCPAKSDAATDRSCCLRRYDAATNTCVAVPGMSANNGYGNGFWFFHKPGAAASDAATGYSSLSTTAWPSSPALSEYEHCKVADEVHATPAEVETFVTSTAAFGTVLTSANITPTTGTGTWDAPPDNKWWTPTPPEHPAAFDCTQCAAACSSDADCMGFIAEMQGANKCDKCLFLGGLADGAHFMYVN